MENKGLMIVCLVFLCLGTMGIFSTESLLRKINKNAGLKTLQLTKTVGFVVCLVALVIIYILNKGEI